MRENFENWFPLRSLCVTDLPLCGGCCAVYAFRDSRNFEILKFGETDKLRRRIFGNFVGGVGGEPGQSTTQFVHRKLFDEQMIDYVELAWIEVNDKVAARLMERRLRENYKAAHGGHRPAWDRQD